MSAFVTKTWVVGLCGGFALFGSACVYHAAIAPLTPGARGVRVEQAEPPAGSTLIGKVQGTNGQGCGLLAGGRGTKDGATAAIKEDAARRGADFVQLTRKQEPYAGHDCFHQEFTLEGLGFRVASASPVAPAGAAAVVPPAAVPVAPEPAPPSGRPSLAIAGALAECAPACSPGYRCNAGVCLALCNPACGPGQHCRADRVCVLATP